MLWTYVSLIVFGVVFYTVIGLTHH